MDAARDGYLADDHPWWLARGRRHPNDLATLARGGDVAHHAARRLAPRAMPFNLKGHSTEAKFVLLGGPLVVLVLIAIATVYLKQLGGL